MPFSVLYDKTTRRRYYYAEGHEPRDFSRKMELMFRASFVTEPAFDSGLLYYDTPESAPQELLRLVKNRFGENGKIVTQKYVDRLLEKYELNELYGVDNVL